ncbi:ATP-binding protein [Streptomyces sp. NPDC001781]
MTMGATPADTGDGETGGTREAHRLRRELARADLAAVPAARRELRALLRHWDRPDRSDVAELLTSELVTNALVHTDDDAVLTAVVSPRGLRVEVRDFTARGPLMRDPAPDEDTNGRGLVLVRSLADAWGIRPHAVGKSVWFELGSAAA